MSCKNAVFVQKVRIACLAGEESMLCCIEECYECCLVCLFVSVEHRKPVNEDTCTHPWGGHRVGGEKELLKSLFCRESKRSK